jgi:ribonucleoside-diphosphate reductase alpha chain
MTPVDCWQSIYTVTSSTDEAEFDYQLFNNDAIEAQRYMDDIVDLELEKIDAILLKIKSDPEDDFIKLYETRLWERIREKTTLGRRTGFGVTGEGDMIAAMGFTYGTDAANDFAEKVQKVLKTAAYYSSVIMAEERGAFPIYSTELERNNPFILRLKEENPALYDLMEKHGRRNIALLTIAPTGSVSILTQTTSGCEPVFLPVYKRRRKINSQEKDTRIDFTDDEGVAWSEYPVFHHHFATWLKAKGYDIDKVKAMKVEQVDELVKLSPYHKATSNDVDWVKKVEMQGRLQKHIDHSISVTVNLPKDATEEMVAKVYETGWRTGCKGLTVYRDGSRDGVLISNAEKKEKEKIEVLHDNHAPKRPKRLKADIHRFQNNNERWIAVVGLLDGRPYEIFTGKLINGLSDIGAVVKDAFTIKNKIEEADGTKKSRYDLEYVDSDGTKHVATGLSHKFDPEYWNYAKLFSGVLRHSMPLVYAHQLIESLNLNDDNLNTWKNGVARVIKKYIKDGEKGKGKCPSCGSDQLEYVEGCLICKSCSWGKCG